MGTPARPDGVVVSSSSRRLDGQRCGEKTFDTSEADTISLSGTQWRRS
jgi:hypothetical protein